MLIGIVGCSSHPCDWAVTAKKWESYRTENNAAGKYLRCGSNFSGQLEFLQVYWFSFWNTIWKASLKLMSKNIFKQGCCRDMFMVDTRSFPSLWYLFGEYVYILFSAGIHQAKTPLGKGNLFFVPLRFERLSGYKKPLKLEPMILRLITVITEPCYSRKSCSFPVRLNMKGNSRE